MSAAPPDNRRRLSRDALGDIAIDLATAFPVWVRRRRFTFSYLGDRTMHWRMSVDFALPEPEWFWTDRPPAPGDFIYVPLHILRKETLTNFSVFDEEAAPLSVMTTEENGALAALGLRTLVTGMARQRIPNMTTAERRALWDDIAAIVVAPQTPSYDPVERTLAPRLRGLLGRALPEQDEVRALLTDLASGFLLLVPVIYEPGRDRVIKAEWDAPFFWQGSESGIRGPRARSYAASFGLIDKEVRVPDLQIGWARSSHVEIVAPEEVQMTSATLLATQYDPTSDALVGPRPVRVAYDQPRINLNVAPLVRSNPLEDRAAARDAIDAALIEAAPDTATVVARLRARTTGVPLAATVLSIATTVLLWFMRSRLAELDVQSGSALLLLFPGIVSAYLARPGEHAFVARLLMGVRASALVVGLCSLAAAALMGLGKLQRDQPSPRPRTTSVACTATNTPATRARPAPVLRELRCTVPARRTASVREPEANPRARHLMTGFAAVATVATALLALGLLRLWWTDRRNRGRVEQLPILDELALATPAPHAVRTETPGTTLVVLAIFIGTIRRGFRAAQPRHED